MVHPLVFGSVLRRDRGIVEYQVRQTRYGAEIQVVGAPADPAMVGRAVAAELAIGLADASVQVRPVDQLERQATGRSACSSR